MGATAPRERNRAQPLQALKPFVPDSNKEHAPVVAEFRVLPLGNQSPIPQGALPQRGEDKSLDQDACCHDHGYGPEDQRHVAENATCLEHLTEAWS